MAPLYNIQYYAKDARWGENPGRFRDSQFIFRSPADTLKLAYTILIQENNISVPGDLA